MVIHAFPAIKLGTLLLKHVNKPITEFIKRQAVKHPLFRKYVCMPPAYIFNWCEVKMRMWTMRTGRATNVPPLNDAMAIELGASIIGEGIMFILAAAAIFREVGRSIRKEEKKEQTRKEEMEKLQYRLQEIDGALVVQENQIDNLNNAVRELQYTFKKTSWFGSSKLHSEDSLRPDTDTAAEDRSTDGQASPTRAATPSSGAPSGSSAEPSSDVSETDGSITEMTSEKEPRLSTPTAIAKTNGPESNEHGLIQDALSYIIQEVFKD